MTKGNITRIFFVILFICTPLSVFAEEVKIGFINMSTIMEKSPQAEAARSELEKEFSGRDKKLTAARDEILKLEEQLKKDGAIMNDARRKELEQDISNKKRDFNRQQDELREDFNIRRNEVLGGLQKKVYEAVVEIAKAENYDLVVTQPVLYASNRIDITEKVLQSLKNLPK